MIMVVFGAGASYDSVPSRPPSSYPRPGHNNRPPLASELFMDSGVVADALSRFPECHPIVPYLQRLPANETIEHTLEVLQSEGETDPERKRQIAAIRFYLHFMIWECERRWNDDTRGITNYATLLDQLRRSRGPEDTVCLVTFNYDCMIETALRSVGITINAIPDYIAHDAFKLFKLHGSVNWGREVDTPVADVNVRSVWDICHELIRKVGELSISTRFRVVQEHPIGRADGVALFPAIGIPVETKRGYECPDDHLECLRSHLPGIRKILVVGWRGTEQHFLNLLRDHLAEEVSLSVVAGEKRSAEEVIARIEAVGVRVAARRVEEGFTDFIVRREAEEFLRG